MHREVGAGGPGTHRLDLSADDGSQVLELVGSLPVVALLLVLLLHTALLGGDIVTAHGLAREAARAAASGEEHRVEAVVTAAAGNRDVDVRLLPPAPERRRGDLVTARIRLHSRAFAAFGVPVVVPAEAAMRVEWP